MLVDDQRVRLTLGINDTKFVRDNIDEIKKYMSCISTFFLNFVVYYFDITSTNDP